MSKGELVIQVTDLRGRPMRDKVEIEFGRFSGELGTGGEALQASFKTGTDTDATITGITCRVDRAPCTASSLQHPIIASTASFN
jgi:hypothetical protein